MKLRAAVTDNSYSSFFSEYDRLFMGNVDMGTVRVNYRFGGPVAARY
jgi:hypothetical protein